MSRETLHSFLLLSSPPCDACWALFYANCTFDFMFYAIRKQAEGSLIKLHFNGFLRKGLRTFYQRSLPARLTVKKLCKGGKLRCLSTRHSSLKADYALDGISLACWVVAADAVGKSLSIMCQPGVILKNVEVPSSGRSQRTVDLSRQGILRRSRTLSSGTVPALTQSQVSETNTPCSFNFIFEQLLAIFLMLCLLAAIYQPFSPLPCLLEVEHSNKSLRVGCQIFHNEPSRVKMGKCQKVSVSLPPPWLLSSS